jgi:lipoprotein-anchoring transpeptidase ErfK/SrfK
MNLNNGLMGVFGRSMGVAAVVSCLVLAMGATADSQTVPRSFGPTTKKLLKLQVGHPPGTIIISTADRTLDFVVDRGRVARYSIGVGRDGFTWAGKVKIGRKAEWPEWRPPAQMRKRQPSLPVMVPAGPFNPLGARAIYLYQGSRDTLYRIHGTNDSSTVGGFVSSGCFRMTNADILELYRKVRIGAKVIVK